MSPEIAALLQAFILNYFDIPNEYRTAEAGEGALVDLKLRPRYYQFLKSGQHNR